MEQKAIQCKNLLVSIILITVGSASQKCKPERYGEQRWQVQFIRSMGNLNQKDDLGSNEKLNFFYMKMQCLKQGHTTQLHS